METIYTGYEHLLGSILIERTIEEYNVDVSEIEKISVYCNMPEDKMTLWTIRIVISTIDGHSCTSYFYSKNCIKHNYSITYLQHLKNMGVKKIKLKKLGAKKYVELKIQNIKKEAL